MSFGIVPKQFKMEVTLLDDTTIGVVVTTEDDARSHINSIMRDGFVYDAGAGVTESYPPSYIKKIISYEDTGK